MRGVGYGVFGMVRFVNRWLQDLQRYIWVFSFLSFRDPALTIGVVDEQCGH